MQAIFATIPSLAVSALYCAWQHYRLTRLNRERALRERVARMLWAMAHLPDTE